MEFRKIATAMLIAISFLFGCKKTETKTIGCTDASAINFNGAANQDCGCCNYKGSGTFWTRTGDGIAVVDVSVGGTSIGAITLDALTAPSSCDVSGTAFFTAAPGSYNYIAVERGTAGRTWNGVINITSKGCSKMQLTP